MRIKAGILSLTVMGLILICSYGAYGQAVNTAQIHGTVTDPTGAVVPNANIQATHVDTGTVRTAVAGSSGEYVLTNLAVGAYSLEVKASGFERYVQKGIVLQVGANVALDVTLKVGATTQTVEVNAGATMVETQDTSISEVIDRQRVDDLPLNGRLPTQLLILSGAALNFTPSGSDLTGSKNYSTSTTISVAGGQANGVEYLLDGADMTDPFTNVNMPLPFPDTLQEFSVQTNGLSARYGVHPGATANFVTKSGSNALHGDLFDFVRNGQFNARLYGAAAEDTLRRNQFGATTGGAIKKDKLFYFGGYQGMRVRTAPPNTVSYVPTAQVMQGNFSTVDAAPCASHTLKDPFPGGPAFTGNIIPTTLFNPVALNFLKLVPQSADPCGKLVYGIPSPQDEDQFLGRVDWTLGSKQNFYGRYFDTDFRQPVYGATGPLGLFTTNNSGLLQRAQAIVLGHTWSISPNKINSAHLSWTRLRDDRVTTPDATNLAKLGMVNTDGSPLFMLVPNYISFSISAYSGGGFSVGAGASQGWFNRNTVQAADDLDFIHGKHHFVFGGDWMLHQLNSSNVYSGNGGPSFNGTISGDGMADLMLGVPVSYTGSGAAAMNLRQTYIGLYAQDDYRVNSRLTFHAGVRWEPYIAVTDEFGRGSHFSSAAFYANQFSSQYNKPPAGLLFYGDPGIPKGYANNAVDLVEPRVGFAWDISGNGKQTLRSSYSIFYDTPEVYYGERWSIAFPDGGSLTINPGTNGCTATAAGTLVGGCKTGLTSPYQNYAGGDPFPTPFPPPKSYVFPAEGGYYNLALNSKVPSEQAWDLSYQRQFPHNWLFSASYLGSHSLHIWSGNEADPAVYNAPGYVGTSTTSNTNQRRVLYLANPTTAAAYSTITQQYQGAYASYNALLVTITHRFSQNFSLLSNYTWSHCLSLADFAAELAGNFFQNSFNPQADYGNSGMQLNNNFNASIVARMPKFENVWTNRLAGNWQFSPIITARSGTWFSVASGSDRSLTGVSQDRPNVSGNPYQYVYNSPKLNYVQWLNPSAFSLNPLGTFGDSGRNSLVGPGSFNVDAALVRFFPVKEQMKFEFRVEAFNMFNRTNLGNPTTTVTSGTFGYIGSAASMRILQLALKFYF